MRELGRTARTVAFDLKPPQGDAPFLRGSVLSLADLEGAMRGVDALVHVAAIPNPRDRPPEIVFETNVRGTWNAFHAAARAGVKKTVLISSECATGLCYQKAEFPPDYLPIDEAYPLRPAEVYGLSKQAAEAVAASCARSSSSSRIITARSPAAPICGTAISGAGSSPTTSPPPSAWRWPRSRASRSSS